VLDALLGAVSRAGVAVESGARVVRIEKGERFRLGIQQVAGSADFGPGVVAALHTAAWPLPAVIPARWIEADAVVLATGGLSFPRTGSDGTGFALAAALGHAIVPPVPALTPLAAADPLCRACQGVTLEAELTLWIEGGREVAVRGSFLFAHFGYSGPAALDLSRHWLRAEGRERRVTVSFVPGGSAEAELAAWLSAAGEEPKRPVRRHLSQWRLPERLAEMLTAESGVGGAAMSLVPRERRAPLLHGLVERDVGVTGTLGYEKAEVTAGGVPLSEVDPSTLESRVAPGLYLCGEILDVEGRLGGFNFQFSWSSGTVAGRAAASRSIP